MTLKSIISFVNVGGKSLLKILADNSKYFVLYVYLLGRREPDWGGFLELVNILINMSFIFMGHFSTRVASEQHEPDKRLRRKTMRVKKY